MITIANPILPFMSVSQFSGGNSVISAVGDSLSKSSDQFLGSGTTDWSLLGFAVPCITMTLGFIRIGKALKVTLYDMGRTNDADQFEQLSQQVLQHIRWGLGLAVGSLIMTIAYEEILR